MGLLGSLGVCLFLPDKVWPAEEKYEISKQFTLSCARVHMGTYICEAFNGVPKNATQEFQIHVYCEFDLKKSHFNTQ